MQQAVTKELAGLDLGPASALEAEGARTRNAAGLRLLGKAFGTAMFLIFAVLLAQFGRFTSVGLVLSAVVFSTPSASSSAT